MEQAFDRTETFIENVLRGSNKSAHARLKDAQVTPLAVKIPLGGIYRLDAEHRRKFASAFPDGALRTDDSGTHWIVVRK
jgi:hypothetical protein